MAYHLLLPAALLASAALASETTDYLREARRQQGVLATRAYYGVGPTCAINEERTSVLCWWSANAPEMGNADTLDLDDPAFLIPLPAGTLGSQIMSVYVLTDVWLLTNAGEIIIAVGAGSDGWGASADAPVNTYNATALLYLPFFSNPVIALDVHPYPATAAYTTTNMWNIREFSAVRADGEVTPFMMTFSPVSINALPWRGAFYDATSLLRRSRVCGTLPLASCVTGTGPHSGTGFVALPPDGHTGRDVMSTSPFLATGKMYSYCYPFGGCGSPPAPPTEVRSGVISAAAQCSRPPFGYSSDSICSSRCFRDSLTALWPLCSARMDGTSTPCIGYAQSRSDGPSDAILSRHDICGSSKPSFVTSTYPGEGDRVPFMGGVVRNPLDPLPASTTRTVCIRYWNFQQNGDNPLFGFMWFCTAAVVRFVAHDNARRVDFQRESRARGPFYTVLSWGYNDATSTFSSPSQLALFAAQVATANDGYACVRVSNTSSIVCLQALNTPAGETFGTASSAMPTGTIPRAWLPLSNASATWDGAGAAYTWVSMSELKVCALRRDGFPECYAPKTNAPGSFQLLNGFARPTMRPLELRMDAFPVPPQSRVVVDAVWPVHTSDSFCMQLRVVTSPKNPNVVLSYHPDDVFSTAAAQVQSVVRCYGAQQASQFDAPASAVLPFNASTVSSFTGGAAGACVVLTAAGVSRIPGDQLPLMDGNSLCWGHGAIAGATAPSHGKAAISIMLTASGTGTEPVKCILTADASATLWCTAEAAAASYAIAAGMNTAGYLDMCFGLHTLCVVMPGGSLRCLLDPIAASLVGTAATAAYTVTVSPLGAGWAYLTATSVWSSLTCGMGFVCGAVTISGSSAGIHCVGRTALMVPTALLTRVTAGRMHACGLSGTSPVCWGDAHPGRGGAATSIGGQQSFIIPMRNSTCMVDVYGIVRCVGPLASRAGGAFINFRVAAHASTATATETITVRADGSDIFCVPCETLAGALARVTGMNATITVVGATRSAPCVIPPRAAGITIMGSDATASVDIVDSAAITALRSLVRVDAHGAVIKALALTSGAVSSAVVAVPSTSPCVHGVLITGRYVLVADLSIGDISCSASIIAAAPAAYLATDGVDQMARNDITLGAMFSPFAYAPVFVNVTDYHRVMLRGMTALRDGNVAATLPAAFALITGVNRATISDMQLSAFTNSALPPLLSYGVNHTCGSAFTIITPVISPTPQVPTASISISSVVASVIGAPSVSGSFACVAGNVSTSILLSGVDVNNAAARYGNLLAVLSTAATSVSIRGSSLRSSSTSVHGGALFVASTLANTVIMDTVLVSSASVGGFGGVAYVASSVNVSMSSITANDVAVAGRGGALFLNDGRGGSGVVNLVDWSLASVRAGTYPIAYIFNTGTVSIGGASTAFNDLWMDANDAALSATVQVSFFYAACTSLLSSIPLQASKLTIARVPPSGSGWWVFAIQQVRNGTGVILLPGIAVAQLIAPECAWPNQSMCGILRVNTFSPSTQGFASVDIGGLVVTQPSFTPRMGTGIMLSDLLSFVSLSNLRWGVDVEAGGSYDTAGGEAWGPVVVSDCPSALATVVTNVRAANTRSLLDGGAIRVRAAGSVTVSNVVLADVRSTNTTNAGGAMWVTSRSDKVTLSDVRIVRSGLIGGVGGAVFASASTGIDATSVSVRNSSASEGGCLYLRCATGTVSLQNVTLATCAATSFGGGAVIATTFGSVGITNISLAGTSAGSCGGAVLISGVTPACRSGGARGGLVMSNVLQQDSIAGTDGGGVHAVVDFAVVTGFTSSNTQAAAGGGGALWLAALSNDATLANVFVTNSTARDDGGAVRVEARRGVVISNAHFSATTSGNGSGGAVAIHGFGSLTMLNANVSSAYAGDSGGAVALRCASAAASLTPLAASASCTADFRNVHTSDTRSQVHGGSVYAVTEGTENPLSVSFAGSMQRATASTGQGGCMFAGAPASVKSYLVWTLGRSNDKATQLDACTAADDGGAVMVMISDTSLALVQASMENVIIANSTSLSGRGGGAFMKATHATLNRTTFTSCRAAVEGGALAAIASKIDISGTVWFRNKAPLGAALSARNCVVPGVRFVWRPTDTSLPRSFMSSNQSWSVSQQALLTYWDAGSLFQENVASVNGGGLLLEVCPAVLDFVQLINNTAGAGGGGVHVTTMRSTSSVQMGVALVALNTARGSDGAAGLWFASTSSNVVIGRTPPALPYAATTLPFAQLTPEVQTQAARIWLLRSLSYTIAFYSGAAPRVMTTALNIALSHLWEVMPPEAAPPTPSPTSSVSASPSRASSPLSSASVSPTASVSATSSASATSSPSKSASPLVPSPAPATLVDIIGNVMTMFVANTAVGGPGGDIVATSDKTAPATLQLESVYSIAASASAQGGSILSSAMNDVILVRSSIVNASVSPRAGPTTSTYTLLATPTNMDAGRGGAIAALGANSVQLQSSFLAWNAATVGGAVWADFTALGTGLTIRSSSLVNNTARIAGGNSYVLNGAVASCQLACDVSSSTAGDYGSTNATAPRVVKLLPSSYLRDGVLQVSSAQTLTLPLLTLQLLDAYAQRVASDSTSRCDLTGTVLDPTTNASTGSLPLSSPTRYVANRGTISLDGFTAMAPPGVRAMLSVTCVTEAASPLGSFNFPLETNIVRLRWAAATLSQSWTALPSATDRQWPVPPMRVEVVDAGDNAVTGTPSLACSMFIDYIMTKSLAVLLSGVRGNTVAGAASFTPSVQATGGSTVYVGASCTWMTGDVLSTSVLVPIQVARLQTMWECTSPSPVCAGPGSCFPLANVSAVFGPAAAAAVQTGLAAGETFVARLGPQQAAARGLMGLVDGTPAMSTLYSIPVPSHAILRACSSPATCTASTVEVCSLYGNGTLAGGGPLLQLPHALPSSGDKSMIQAVAPAARVALVFDSGGAGLQLAGASSVLCTLRVDTTYALLPAAISASLIGDTIQPSKQGYATFENVGVRGAGFGSLAPVVVECAWSPSEVSATPTMVVQMDAVVVSAHSWPASVLPSGLSQQTWQPISPAPTAQLYVATIDFTGVAAVPVAAASAISPPTQLTQGFVNFTKLATSGGTAWVAPVTHQPLTGYKLSCTMRVNGSGLLEPLPAGSGAAITTPQLVGVSDVATTTAGVARYANLGVAGPGGGTLALRCACAWISGDEATVVSPVLRIVSFGAMFAVQPPTATLPSNPQQPVAWNPPPAVQLLWDTGAASAPRSLTRVPYLLEAWTTSCTVEIYASSVAWSFSASTLTWLAPGTSSEILARSGANPSIPRLQGTVGVVLSSTAANGSFAGIASTGSLGSRFQLQLQCRWPSGEFVSALSNPVSFPIVMAQFGAPLMSYSGGALLSGAVVTPARSLLPPSYILYDTPLPDAFAVTMSYVLDSNTSLQRFDWRAIDATPADLECTLSPALTALPAGSSSDQLMPTLGSLSQAADVATGRSTFSALSFRPYLSPNYSAVDAPYMSMQPAQMYFNATCSVRTLPASAVITYRSTLQRLRVHWVGLPSSPALPSARANPVPMLAQWDLARAAGAGVDTKSVALVAIGVYNESEGLMSGVDGTGLVCSVSIASASYAPNVPPENRYAVLSNSDSVTANGVAAFPKLAISGPLGFRVRLTAACQRQQGGPLYSTTTTVVFDVVEVEWAITPAPWQLYNTPTDMSIRLKRFTPDIASPEWAPLAGAPATPAVGYGCSILVSSVSLTPVSLSFYDGTAFAITDARGVATFQLALTGPYNSPAALWVSCNIADVLAVSAKVNVSIEQVMTYYVTPPPRVWMPSSDRSKLPITPAPTILMRSSVTSAPVNARDASCIVKVIGSDPLAAVVEGPATGYKLAIPIALSAAAAANATAAAALEQFGRSQQIQLPGILISAAWAAELTLQVQCTRIQGDVTAALVTPLRIPAATVRWAEAPPAVRVTQTVFVAQAVLLDAYLLPPAFGYDVASRTVNSSLALMSVMGQQGGNTTLAATAELLQSSMVRYVDTTTYTDYGRNESITVSVGGRSFIPVLPAYAFNDSQGWISSQLAASLSVEEQLRLLPVNLTHPTIAGAVMTLDAQSVCTMTISSARRTLELDATVGAVRIVPGVVSPGVSLSQLVLINGVGTSNAGVVPFAGASVTAPSSVTVMGELTCALGSQPVLNSVSWAVSMQPCPHGAAPSANGLSCVTCGPVTYSDGGVAATTCISCPRQGTTCNAGILMFLPGFYRLQDGSRSVSGSTEIYPCWSPAGCIVATQLTMARAANETHRCAPGYEGPLCGVCSVEGYAKTGTFCTRCMPDAFNLFVVSFVPILIIAFVAYISVFSGSNEKSATNMMRAQIAFRIVISYVQTLGTLGSLYAARGTALFRQLFGFTDVVGDSVLQIAPVQCTLRLGYYARFGITEALPLMMTSAAILVNMFRIFVVHSVAAWRAWDGPAAWTEALRCRCGVVRGRHLLTSVDARSLNNVVEAAHEDVRILQKKHRYLLSHLKEQDTRSGMLNVMVDMYRRAVARNRCCGGGGRAIALASPLPPAREDEFKVVSELHENRLSVGTVSLTAAAMQKEVDAAVVAGTAGPLAQRALRRNIQRMQQAETRLRSATAIMDSRTRLAADAPAEMTIMTAAAAVTSRMARDAWDYFELRTFIGPTVLILNMAYATETSTAFRMFDCLTYPIGGKYYMTGDLAVQCYTVEHNLGRVTAAIAILLFAFGFPIFFFYTLWSNRYKLHTTLVSSRYSFMYSGYRTTGWLYSWESLVLMRKALVVAIGSLVKDPYYQIIAAITLLCVALFMHSTYSPFQEIQFNALEAVALGGIILTQIVSLFYLRWDTLTKPCVGASPELLLDDAGLTCARALEQKATNDNVVTAALVSVNVIVILYLGRAFIGHVMQPWLDAADANGYQGWREQGIRAFSRLIWWGPIKEPPRRVEELQSALMRQRRYSGTGSDATSPSIGTPVHSMTIAVPKLSFATRSVRSGVADVMKLTPIGGVNLPRYSTNPLHDASSMRITDEQVADSAALGRNAYAATLHGSVAPAAGDLAVECVSPLRTLTAHVSARARNAAAGDEQRTAFDPGVARVRRTASSALATLSTFNVMSRAPSSSIPQRRKSRIAELSAQPSAEELNARAPAETRCTREVTQNASVDSTTPAPAGKLPVVQLSEGTPPSSSTATSRYMTDSAVEPAPAAAPVRVVLVDEDEVW